MVILKTITYPKIQTYLDEVCYGRHLQLDYVGSGSLLVGNLPNRYPQSYTLMPLVYTTCPSQLHSKNKILRLPQMRSNV